MSWCFFKITQLLIFGSSMSQLTEAFQFQEAFIWASKKLLLLFEKKTKKMIAYKRQAKDL